MIPYRRTAPAPTSRPLLTLGTKDSAGLLRRPGGGTVAAEDCYFRMLQWREQLSAQRFPGDYIVHGTSNAERTMQAGNAVSCNVAQWLGEAVSAVL